MEPLCWPGSATSTAINGQVIQALAQVVLEHTQDLDK
jgi:hypothetical protein